MLSVVALSTAWPRVTPSTEMPVTRVRPIARADAVAPVRRGLRTAFCAASLPETPNIRCSSGRTRAITGRDSSGIRMMMPMRARKEPPAMRSWPFDPACAAPPTTAAPPSRVMTAPIELRSTRDFTVATAYWLFIAATGGIFAARRAGSQAASTVIRTPTPKAAMTVVGEMTSGPAGIFPPIRLIAERSPVARPRPSAKPTTDAIRPTTAASSSTERLT